MAYEKNPDELGALWLRVSQNGRRFMTGTISGVGDVVIFENERKSGKAPDYRVYKSKPRDGQSSGTQKLDTREDDRRPSRVDDAEDDFRF